MRWDRVKGYGNIGPWLCDLNAARHTIEINGSTLHGEGDGNILEHLVGDDVLVGEGGREVVGFGEESSVCADTQLSADKEGNNKVQALVIHHGPTLGLEYIRWFKEEDKLSIYIPDNMNALDTATFKH